MLTVGFKNAVSIELTAFLTFFIFCSGAVPSYSSHSQENEIQKLSQQPTACRKHFFDKLKATRNELLLSVYNQSDV